MFVFFTASAPKFASSIFSLLPSLCLVAGLRRSAPVAFVCRSCRELGHNEGHGFTVRFTQERLLCWGRVFISGQALRLEVSHSMPILKDLCFCVKHTVPASCSDTGYWFSSFSKQKYRSIKSKMSPFIPLRVAIFFV